MRTAHTLPVLAFVAVALAGCTYNEDDLKAGQPNPRDAAADLPGSGGEDLLGTDEHPVQYLPDAGSLAEGGQLGTPDAETDAEEAMGPDSADAVTLPEVTDGLVDRVQDGSPDAGLGDLPDSGPGRETPPANEIGISTPQDLAPDVVTPIDMGRDAGDGRIDGAGSDLQVTESGSVDLGSQSG